jgi:hypothetical protein
MTFIPQLSRFWRAKTSSQLTAKEARNWAARIRCFRSPSSNNLLAPAPAFQPSGNTPRPQMICLLSAKPHHNAFHGGACQCLFRVAALSSAARYHSLVWDGCLAAPISSCSACHLFAPHRRTCRMAPKVGQIVRRGRCSGSSQQNARRARPRAKARLVEANAQSIVGPLA